MRINAEWKKGKNKCLQFLPHNIKDKLVILKQIFRKTVYVRLISAALSREDFDIQHQNRKYA